MNSQRTQRKMSLQRRDAYPDETSSIRRPRAGRVMPLVMAFMSAGCSGGKSGTDQPAVAPHAAADTGERLYDGNCIACHQPDGHGIPGVYPSLVESPVVLGDPSDLALWVIKGQRSPAMPAGRYSTAMPLFGWLTGADAAALFTHLRSSFGNSAPPVDAATVARALGKAL